AGGRAKRRQIDVIDAVADFLVAGEEDAHRSVRDFWLLPEMSGQFHDHGQARLVVGAQERRAVAGDDRAADELAQLGIVGDADDLRLVAGQREVAAIIVSDYLRFDPGAGRVGGGVNVRIEGDCRDGFFDRGGNGRGDNAKLVLGRIV